MRFSIGVQADCESSVVIACCGTAAWWSNPDDGIPRKAKQIESCARRAICATDNTFVGPDQVFCWTVPPDVRSREGLKLR